MLAYVVPENLAPWVIAGSLLLAAFFGYAASIAEGDQRRSMAGAAVFCALPGIWLWVQLGSTSGGG